VARPSRLGILGLAAAVVASLLVAAAMAARAPLERHIRARIEREASRRGMLVSIDTVRLGPWPPLRLGGVRVEKPGAFSLAADSVGVTLRARGRGLVGRTRVSLGHAVLSGPAGLSIDAEPTVWDLVTAVDRMGADLHAPARGLALAWIPTSGGDRIEVVATSAPLGRLFRFQRDRLPIVDAGTVSGRLHLDRAEDATALDLTLSGRGVRFASLVSETSIFDPPAFGQPTDVALRLAGVWRPREGALDVPSWQVDASDAVLSGSLSLVGVPDDPRLDMSLDVERVDFARLFETSGLDQPGVVAIGASSIPRDLGSASLSARVAGRLADPTSFAVTQKLDFTPPRQLPPVLLRLRGDFSLDVVPASGGRKVILVSPSSPDFISIGEVPALFLRTLLIAEDAGFWGHRGIDLSELPSAILTNWARGGAARGASTITQQLVKNLFLSRDKNLGRKLHELSLALLVEATLSKQRILEIYLNVIEWGPDLYGLRPAARHYFLREPPELTPAQMAFLVALIPGPVKYQRSFADGTPSPAFRQLVDKLLVKLRSVDALNEEAYEAARAEELRVGEPSPEGVAAAPDAAQ
jgi:Transglycosylase